MAVAAVVILVRLQALAAQVVGARGAREACTLRHQQERQTLAAAAAAAAIIMVKMALMVVQAWPFFAF